MCSRTLACLHIYIQIHISLHIYTHIHAHSHTHGHTQTHTDTHTRTHTDTHTQDHLHGHQLASCDIKATDLLRPGRIIMRRHFTACSSQAAGHSGV
jgi:hypothetical protein